MFACANTSCWLSALPLGPSAITSAGGEGATRQGAYGGRKAGGGCSYLSRTQSSGPQQPGARLESGSGLGHVGQQTRGHPAVSGSPQARSGLFPRPTANGNGVRRSRSTGEGHRAVGEVSENP